MKSKVILKNAKTKIQKIGLAGVLGIGALLRLYYIWATPVIQQRQYDLGTAVPSDGIFTGHLGYIFYLFTNKVLPGFDPREVYQFFHPPLHHIISALWMKFISLFTNDQRLWVESLQVLPFLYSVLIVFIIWQICKKWKLSDGPLLVVMSIVSFHPSLIFMAGSINNDCLSLLFQFLTIWFTLCWYEKRDYKNIIGIALSISLGMITKLSVGMFAIPVGFLFLYVFIKEWKKDGFPIKRLVQYIVFGLVCIPIGLSWAVRCLIRFDMPLTYVNHLPKESWQYVGNYTFVERFFIPNPIEFIMNLAHGSIGFGENVWVQMFRTAALGECDLSSFPFWGKGIALLMIAVAFLIAIWSFVTLLRVFVFGKNEKYSVLDLGNRCFWLLCYITLFVSYLNFCYNFPHQCTMNFRYMVPTVLFPAVSAGIWMQNTKKMKCLKVLGILTTVYVLVSFLTVVVWSITV